MIRRISSWSSFGMGEYCAYIKVTLSELQGNFFRQKCKIIMNAGVVYSPNVILWV